MDPVELWREEVQSQLTKIEGHLKTQNGHILRHNEEIFGSEDHGTVGLKPDVRDLKILVIQAKTVLRIFIGVVALVGVTNIWILIRSTGTAP